MSTEAGWYYAQGDPPGTVRRWNGVEWIGYPVMEPTAEGMTPSAELGVAPFRPHPGQVSLKVFAVLAQLALIVVSIANVYFGVALLQLVRTTGGRVVTPSILGELAPEIDRVALANFVSLLATLATGIMVIIWFALAYRNMSLWQRNRRGTAWTVFAWLVPFVNLVRPMSMMMELAEGSPRPDRKESLSPVPIMVWWISWLLVPFGVAAFFRGAIAETSPELLVTGLSVVQFASVIPALLAIYIVQGITDAQEGRRRPSPAQLAMMKREAEIATFHQSQDGYSTAL